MRRKPIDPPQTLDAFIIEAGLAPDAGTTEAGDLTIEKILEEKKQYDKSLAFERRPKNGLQGWTSKGKIVPLAVEPRNDLSTSCRHQASH